MHNNNIRLLITVTVEVEPSVLFEYAMRSVIVNLYSALTLFCAFVC